jgi:hypothetical protein
MLKIISDFVNLERWRFETRHNSMFGFAFSEINRYHDFLVIIHKRYKNTSKLFIENFKTQQKTIQPGTHPITPEQMQLMAEQRQIMTNLQLECESFYLFAKILLDKIARAVEFYFGQAKGISLDSHDDLNKNLHEYSKLKSLKLSDEFVSFITNLKKEISDFRDYQISHEKSPRIVRGMTWDAEGNTRMMISKIYPTEKDKQIETKRLDELLGEIEAYIEQTVNFILSNKNKTGLKLDVKKR